MPKMTDEQTLELAKEIVKVLNQNIEWEEPKIQNPFELYKGWYDKFGKHFLTDGKTSLADFGFKAFEYGVTSADRVTKEVSLEQLEKEVADWDFMESVKQWIDETQRGVTPTSKVNPIVELIGGYIKPECEKCQMRFDGYCDGDNTVNLNEVVSENPKIS